MYAPVGSVDVEPASVPSALSATTVTPGSAWLPDCTTPLTLQAAPAVACGACACCGPVQANVNARHEISHTRVSRD